MSTSVTPASGWLNRPAGSRCYIPTLVIFLTVVVLSGLHGDWLEALLSLLLLLLLCVVFYPLTRMLFTDKTDALILALPTGLVLHALLLSFNTILFGVHRWSAVGYLAFSFLVWLFLRWRFKPDPGENQWNNGHVWTLFLWLIVSLLIVALPFARVGVETEQGLAYRAYFNADFFRNMAVTGSLAHTGIPPDNPYLGGNTLHYYWFFHLIVAYWRELFPTFRPDSLMVQFSLVAMLLFVATLFVVIRRWARHTKTLLLLLPIFAFGGSYEGPYVLQWLKSRNMEWTQFVNLNIDGILRWNWRAPQIDTLYRALLYAPQHLVALAIFLLALLVWNSQRLNENPLRCNTRRLLFYCLIFSTLGFSAFVGATLIAGAAIVLFIQTLRNLSGKWKELAFSGLLGLAFLAMYLFLFQMFQPGTQEYDLGPDRTIVSHFPAYFLLSWGGLLIFGVAGLFLRSDRFPNRILIPYLGACFLLIVFVRIMLAGSSDISLKVGHLANVILVLLSAGFIDAFLTRVRGRVRWLSLAIFIIVMPALLTWGMDAWNSSDVKSRRFTTYLSKEDAEVTRWMQQNIPARAVVLNYSSRYDDFMQDIIPAFAERSVFVGNRIFSRIFQVSEDVVRERGAIVSAILQFTSAEETWRLARQAGIEYVFVSAADSSELSTLTGKLKSPYFALLMQEGSSGLFRVNSDISGE